MSENVTVELRIVEQIFRLSTTQEKKPQLEQAAELLNAKFQEFRKNSPRVEHNKLVIMVALDFMQEILALNKSLQHYEQCKYLLSSILEETEKPY